MAPEWQGGSELVVDGVQFKVNEKSSNVGAGRAEAGGDLVLKKTRSMLDRYFAMRSQLEGANIVELGIYEGGSAALMTLLFRPGRLVTVDLTEQRVPELDAFIEARGLTDTLRPHYGVDQSDQPRLLQIMKDEFADAPLDLVVDDASHLLGPTTASFNVLFPLLRPGGLFIIEDWSAELDVDARIAARLRSDPDALADFSRRFAAGEITPVEVDPLARLVLQLVLASVYSPSAVAEVMSVEQGFAVVRRGDAVLDPTTFDITESYGGLGIELLPTRRR
jgi:hypothetical protein